MSDDRIPKGPPVEVFNSDKDWKDRGFHLRQPPMVIVNYDPAGDGDDYDALVAMYREEHQRGEPIDPDFAVEQKFRILMCQRFPQHQEFPDKMAALLAMHRQLINWQLDGRIHGHAIGIESNGVGWGLASAMRDKVGDFIIPYTTVGGTADKPYAGGNVSMPRLAALDHMRIMLETHHVRVITKAPGVKDLIAELNSFVWRRAGRPEAMDGQRDDLVMATCGGIWLGTKIIGPTLKGTRRIN